jgi:hypothetical protein
MRIPAVSTCAGPNRDTSSEPGRAAIEKSTTGRLVSAATADCDSAKLRASTG